MKGLRTPTQEQAGALIALAAVIFGGWVRLLIPWIAGFPVNDGGLFYVMVRAIQANGLRIPATVKYNGITIPFAYPPLGLFTGAAISSLFHLDPIRVIQWLPGIVLIGTLPAIYLLARAILGSSLEAGAATLMYAFTPRAITWQIMGGGLTRSFGQVFLLLALLCVYQTFSHYSRRTLLRAILFSTLVVLSHPEAALQTVAVAILFWLFKGRTRQSALHAIVIGAGTLVLSAIWWVPLVQGTGLKTLISAGQTGLNGAYALVLPFLLNFVDEPLMTIVAVLGMIGFAAQAAKRQFLIPIWFILPFLVEPRSAPTFATIPLAMLAGIALSEVILPALTAFEKGAPKSEIENPLGGTAAPMFLLFIGIYMLGSTSYFGTQIAGTTVSQANREAFDWVRTNTPADSRFLVLTGNTQDELFCNGPQEWFPALTGRTSLTTVQGREWNGQDFGQMAADARAAEACLSASDPLHCIEELAGAAAGLLQYDHLYVARGAPILNACRATGRSMPGERLIAALKAAPRYSKIYETADVAIFVRNGKP